MSMREPNLNQGLFAIRGDLDGELEGDFSQREQLIGLKIGKEEFYLPISSISEIGMMQALTYVPRCHMYVEGVINLRGTIMPAINLRKMMGLSRGEVTQASRMIIAHFEGHDFCLIVDGITYVVSLPPSDIENQSLPNRSQGADLISRIAKEKEKILGVLDLGKILDNVKISSNQASDQVHQA